MLANIYLANIYLDMKCLGRKLCRLVPRRPCANRSARQFVRRQCYYGGVGRAELLRSTGWGGSDACYRGTECAHKEYIWPKIGNR